MHAECSEKLCIVLRRPDDGLCARHFFIAVLELEKLADIPIAHDDSPWAKAENRTTCAM